MDKLDMSKNCGFNDVEMWHKRDRNEITQEEYDIWVTNNCSKCTYSSDICMYGEE